MDIDWENVGCVPDSAIHVRHDRQLGIWVSRATLDDGSYVYSQGDTRGTAIEAIFDALLLRDKYIKEL